MNRQSQQGFVLFIVLMLLAAGSLWLLLGLQKIEMQRITIQNAIRSAQRSALASHMATNLSTPIMAISPAASICDGGACGLTINANARIIDAQWQWQTGLQVLSNNPKYEIKILDEDLGRSNNTHFVRRIVQVRSLGSDEGSLWVANFRSDNDADWKLVALQEWQQ